MSGELYHLGYVLGAVVGDGCMYMYRDKRGSTHYFVELETADYNFAMRFAESLKAILGREPLIQERTRFKMNPHGKYHFGKYIRVRVSSKNLYERLQEMKGHVLNGKIPIHDREFIVGFLKGLFDAEGSLSIDKYPNRVCYNLRIYNKNLKLLELVMKLLYELGIKKVYLRNYQKGRLVPFLEIQDRDEIAKFQTIVNGAIMSVEVVRK